MEWYLDAPGHNGGRKYDDGDPPEWWFPALVRQARKKQRVLLEVLPRLLKALSGIEVWLIGGSLLGQARHGSFIPHDDDLDLGCWRTDVAAIGAALQSTFGDISFVWADESIWRGRRFANATFHHDSPEARCVVDFWYVDDQHEVILCERPDEIRPLEDVVFAGMPFKRPSKWLNYLDRVYPNWASEIVVWGHQDNWSAHSVWRCKVEQYNALVEKIGE